jgi:hypothetical protein
VLVGLIGAAPPAAGQVTVDYDIDRDIAEYEDTLRKIRNEKWVFLVSPFGGGLIGPEQEAARWRGVGPDLRLSRPRDRSPPPATTPPCSSTP